MIRGWILHQSEPTNREIYGFSPFLYLYSLLWVCICIYFDLMYIYRPWRCI
jgi:hypothetical protein